MVINRKDQLYVDLSVLGQLAEGDKLAVLPDGSMSIEPPTRLQGVWRSIAGGSREETVTKVWSVVTVDLFEAVIVARRGGFDAFDSERLAEGVQSAIRGVEALMLTYAGDSVTCAKLTFLRSKLEHFANVLSEGRREKGAKRGFSSAASSPGPSAPVPIPGGRRPALDDADCLSVS
mmetsp:Transcript_12791/g.37547  ORF Transcript_12791/g.37547 Transcript_12791/m.37547 type:complete len:176 (+) Transcript_12791:1771-2298(+)